MREIHATVRKISVRTPVISIESRVSKLSYLGSHLGEAGLELVGGDVG